MSRLVSTSDREQAVEAAVAGGVAAAGLGASSARAWAAGSCSAPSSSSASARSTTRLTGLDEASNLWREVARQVGERG